MRISVICPTFNRPERHANLYAGFANQTYTDKELLVLDDSPQISSFFFNLADPRVQYQHISSRTTIGHKRNLLIDLSSGDVIAHFDDDDYYAPQYLETMIELLGDADFVKLSRWFGWRELDGSLWDCDMREVWEAHYVLFGHGPALIEDCRNWDKEKKAVFLDANLWGYGFTYVYRKSLWQICPFPRTNSSEDYKFICKVRELGKTLVHSGNYPHLALHTLHPKSTSAIFPKAKVTPAGTLDLFKTTFPWLTYASLKRSEN